MATPPRRPSDAIVSHDGLRARPFVDPGSLWLREIISAQGSIARTGLDPKTLVDAIAGLSQELTGSTGAQVEATDLDGLVYRAASGSMPAHADFHLSRTDSLSGLCVQTGDLLQCDDSETDPRFDSQACRRMNLRSALVARLSCGNHVVGMLKVVSDRPFAYTPREVLALRMFSVFVGATLHYALENVRTRGAADLVAEGEERTASRRCAQRDDLRGIIRRGCITPVFQPIVDLTTQHVVGYEGLSRFPARPPPPAGGWFAVAGDLGLCEELEVACIVVIVAAASGLPAGAYLSVNVSPETLMYPALETLFSSIAPDRLVIEITEHSEVRNYAALAARVEGLRALGWRFAIDDAGAGYASLRHVLRLKPDLIKLDLSLTRGIDTKLQHRQLTAAIVSFARDTGVLLVAEGIETTEERDALVALGVGYGQGYLLGRPTVLPA